MNADFIFYAALENQEVMTHEDVYSLYFLKGWLPYFLLVESEEYAIRNAVYDWYRL